ncbi:MAG: UbiX family flavin prenyltransferase [Acidaminococcales bacterium]|jgi:4-hydroxy-3-polyprenylbenzoate decarboxylase|nr:UbiX family flavin prenyltransferase [Acidaminococcales bacterium]
MKRIIVGISGASGQIYGIRLLELLRRFSEVEIHLVISDWAKKTMRLETDWTSEQAEALAHRVYDCADQSAAISSGSFPRAAMFIAPCSVKTLSAIAHSYTDNLLLRAADVTLKERKPLLLAFRETPFHAGHIELMRQAAGNGAIIAPPVPAFYNRPATVAELVDHTICRYLELLGLSVPGAKRWQGTNAN